MSAPSIFGRREPGAGFRLLTLGTAELCRINSDDSRDTLALNGKPLALLVRLTFCSAHTISRDILAEDLWSELEASRAKAQLRTALWSLRKHIGDDAIRADDSTLSLAIPVSSDRADLESAIRNKDRAAAVTLYRGDFLAHFAVSDARGFEEWAEFERRNLRGLFAAAVEAQVTEMLRAARFPQAVDLARRAREIEPLRPDAWRLLITALGASGDTVSARAEAHAFEEMLRAEAITPDEPTQRALRVAYNAKEQPEAADDHEALVADLVGRERELASLLALSDAIDRRTPRAVHVAGPAGIGKTRLLRDFERAARFRRRRVVFVSSVRATARIPWGAVARIADRLATLPGAMGINERSAAVLVALNPALSSTFHGEQIVTSEVDFGRVLMIAFAELLRAVADECPLVLVVDDVQWLDAASRELLESLPGLCETSPLLMVLSERDSTGSVANPTPFVAVPLSPLSAEDCESLVASIATLPAEPWCSRWIAALHTTSGGVPLAILDLVRLGVEQDRVSIHNGAWATPDEEALIRLTDQTGPRQARMRGLSDGAHRLVTLLAVGAGPLEIDVALRVLGTELSAFGETTDELTRRGMANVTGTLVALEHEEYGAVARDTSVPDQRRHLQLALARELASSDEPDLLRRAYFCADGAGSDELRELIAATYVRVMQTRFPHRQIRDHLSELIGLGTRADWLDRLERLLDTRSAVKRRALAMTGVIGVLALSTMGVLLARGRDRRTPDAVVEVVLSDSAGNVSLAETALDLTSWVPGRPVRVDASRAVRIGSAPASQFARNPRDGSQWVAVREYPAPALEELELWDGKGGARALSPAPGDDVYPAWSPDGARIVFVTARWTGKDWSDLAIVDVASGAVSRLGGGPGELRNPAFRDDGLGVAFIRVSVERHTPEVCAMSLVTRQQICHTISGPVDLQIAPRWSSAGTVLFAVLDSVTRQSRVLAWNTATNTEREVATCDGALEPRQALQVFLICLRGADSQARELAPLTRPDAWRPLDLRGVDDRASYVHVRDPGSSSTATVKLRIVGSLAALVDVPHKLTTVTERADGSSGVATGIAWDVAGGKATIDSAGVVRASEPGSVLVRARAGAGLVDTMRIVMRERADTLLLNERWDRSWLSRWRRFGQPLPVVIATGEESAFYNNGDGAYFSGVYSRSEYPTDGGIALDAVLSTPITMHKWQTVVVGLVTLDDAALSRWDHVTGYVPSRPHRFSCEFVYPSDVEGASWGSHFAAAAPMNALAPSRMKAGADYRVRLQIFPDGRCGFAMNGKAIAVDATIRPTVAARVMTYGSSVGTKMLVKKLTVTRGVPGDVDWRRVMP